MELVEFEKNPNLPKIVETNKSDDLFKQIVILSGLILTLLLFYFARGIKDPENNNQF